MSDTATITTKPRRRWPRFNLRSALIVLTISGLLFGGGIEWWRRAWRDATNINFLRARGAQLGSCSCSERPRGPFGLLPPDLSECFFDVRLHGRQFTDQDLELVSLLKGNRNITLSDTSISLAAVALYDPTSDCRPDAFSMDLGNDIYRSGLPSACQVLLDYERALEWKVACAHYKGDRAAEKQIYAQCLQMVRNSINAEWFVERAHEEMYRRKIAWLELQIAQCEQNTTQIVAIAKAWDERAKKLPEVAKPSSTASGESGIDVLILATRLARELRSAIAQSRGDRMTQVRACDSAVSTLQTALRELLDAKTDFAREHLDDHWASSLVIALETEELHRAHLLGNVISLADDTKTIRRLGQARAGIIRFLQTNPYTKHRHHCWSMMHFADQLLFEANRRHPALPVADPQFAAEYNDFLLNKVSWSNDSPNLTTDPPWLILYLLRRHAQHGEAVFALTQHELDQLLSQKIHFKWSIPSFTPTADDWRREYEGALKEVKRIPSGDDHAAPMQTAIRGH